MEKVYKEHKTYTTEIGYVATPSNDEATVKAYNETYNISKPDEITKIKEKVDHPSHYIWLKELCGIEPIDIIRHLPYNIGAAIKYELRDGKYEVGYTPDEKRIEDLEKAIWHLKDEIKRIKGQC